MIGLNSVSPDGVNNSFFRSRVTVSVCPTVSIHQKLACYISFLNPLRCKSVKTEGKNKSGCAYIVVLAVPRLLSLLGERYFFFFFEMHSYITVHS